MSGIDNFCNTTDAPELCKASADALLSRCAPCLKDPNQSECAREFEAPEGMSAYFPGVGSQVTCNALKDVLPAELLR